MKQIIVLATIFLLLALNVYAVEGPIPVLYFSFDKDAGNKVGDLSGNKNDGVITGKGTFDPGEYNNGLTLGKPDYVRVRHSDTLVINEELTVGIWVNLADTANQKVIGKSPTASGFVIGVNGGLYPECWTNAGAVLTVTQGNIPVSTWTHLALTYSSKTRNMILYIDGEEVGKLNNNGNPLGETNSDLLIGAAPWDPAQWQSAGIYDEVKIYNVVLDGKQVKKMMKEGVSGGNAVTSLSKFTAIWGEIKSR